MAIQTQQNYNNNKDTTRRKNEEFHKNLMDSGKLAMYLFRNDPKSMAGYAVGKIFSQPFHNWLEKLWGVPKEKTTTVPENIPSQSMTAPLDTTPDVATINPNDGTSTWKKAISTSSANSSEGFDFTKNYPLGEDEYKILFGGW